MSEWDYDYGPDDLESVEAPCGSDIYGNPVNIDSGLRHHIDQCGQCQEILDEQKDNR